MLLQKFKIDTEKINERNKKLMKLNLLDKMDSKQKKYLNFRKGPPGIMNTDGLFGYTDLSDYLID